MHGASIISYDSVVPAGSRSDSRLDVEQSSVLSTSAPYEMRETLAYTTTGSSYDPSESHLASSSTAGHVRL